MDASKSFVSFIAETDFPDLPEAVVEIIKKQVLDIIATAFGGMSQREIKTIREIIVRWGGREEASLWGFGEKVPSQNAALVNSIMSFCLDYDDTHDRGNLHGGVVVVPVALAVAEMLGKISGEKFINAISLGLELAVRLGIAAKRPIPNHIMGGWDYAALHGCFSATAVAGKLMGLNRKQLHHALGIAYHQTGGNGLSALDLADTKKLGPGFASQAGITSALFAQAGLTGAHRIFHETDQSLFNLYHAGCNEKALLEGLGNKFELSDLGFKPYPSCRLGHSYIDAVLKLVRENHIESADILSISLDVCRFTHLQLCVPETEKRKPVSTMAAQFSLPWVIACAVVRNKVGIAEISENSFKERQLLDMAAKVHTILDPSLDDELASARVCVQTRNGVFETKTAHALGTIDNPMTYNDIENKLYKCVSFHSDEISEKNIQSLTHLIGELQEIKDVTEIVRLLTAIRR
jgi:2-methylcitrate dehydratase PrpD